MSNSSRPARIDRQSTGFQVADVLRRMLLAGDLKPGDRLREADLATDLSVSRGSVREGLQALISEGLIEQQFHRGAVVRSLTETDVVEIQSIRHLVEGAAIQASPAASASMWATVDEELDGLRAAAEAGDWLAAASCDLRFHTALVGFLGNSRLQQLSESMQRELHLILAIGAEAHYPDPRTLVPDHEELVSLLRAGELNTASTLLSEHLNAAQANYIQTIRNAAE